MLVSNSSASAGVATGLAGLWRLLPGGPETSGSYRLGEIFHVIVGTCEWCSLGDGCWSNHSRFEVADEAVGRSK